MKFEKQEPTTERGRVQQQYNSARSNLLLVIILTIVNIVLFYAQSGSMLLFSASIPYYAVIFGVELGLDVYGLGVAAVLIVLYFLCWLLSKNKPGWLIVALVLFVLDTLGMAGLYLMAQDFSGIMDALIHIWVLYYLVIGISSGKKLKTLPPEAVYGDGEVEAMSQEHSVPSEESEQM